MDYIYVGEIYGTHGLKGELKFKSSFKYKERILTNGFKFYIGKDKDKYILETYRMHKGFYLLTFCEYNDINLVQHLKGMKVYIDRDDLNLNDDQLVFEDYIGLECYYDDNNLGTITEIVNCGSDNFVFVISGKGEILVPFNDHFIDRIIKNDKIVFKNLEGLLDEN